MSIYAMKHDALQGIINECAKGRPNVGRQVRITRGRHIGVVGTVTWHGRDRFSHAFRYGDDASHLLLEARGQYGYRVRIQPKDGSDQFFVSAENIETCEEGSEP